jgi:hypothetical protein
VYAHKRIDVGTRRAALLEQESHTKERSTPRSYIFRVKLYMLSPNFPSENFAVSRFFPIFAPQTKTIRL